MAFEGFEDSKDHDEHCHMKKVSLKVIEFDFMECVCAQIHVYAHTGLQ
jgi:hypothetical protein